MAVGAEGSHGGTGESGAKRALARDRRIELRQVRPHLAVVGHGLSRARPADDREVPGPQVERRVDAVEVLIPASVVARGRDEIAHLTGLVRGDIVQARHHVAAAARQAGIDWSHDAEGCQIGRLQRQVVGNGKAMEPATAVGERRRCPGKNLPLHRDVERPVRWPDAPAVENRRIEVVGQHILPELGVRHDAAQVATTRPEVLRARVQQVAIGHEVAVRIAPGPCDTRGAEP